MTRALITVVLLTPRYHRRPRPGRARRIARGPQRATGRGGGTEAVAPERVQVAVLERGEPGDVLGADLVALGTELGDGEPGRARGHSGAHARPRTVVPAVPVTAGTMPVPVAVMAVAMEVVPVLVSVPVRRPVLDHLAHPAVDDRVPVLVLGSVAGDPEAGDRVVAGGEEAAAFVGLQDDLHLVAVGEEGHLELGDRVRVFGGSCQLDLLVEGQLLAGAADVTQLQVGGLEAEAELSEGFQDRLLDGQRGDGQRVQVTLVPGARHRQLGAHAQDDAQALPVQLRDRRFPRQGDRERLAVPLALA
ncbi:hypothetical protein GCM10010349_77970 [Streptomyces flavofungini]|nr:hypothetical protein GCM10010349_77970 [Streptomyces flavofungini]